MLPPSHPTSDSTSGPTSEAVARIVERFSSAPARASRTRVLAIDGPSGAGKTTLGQAVRTVLDATPETQTAMVYLEDLYPGWDGLAAVVPRLLEWVLQPLAANRSAGYHRYDWDRGRYAEWHPVPSAPVLIVEGVGAGSLPCAPYLSLLVYVEAQEPIRLARAIARDGETYRPYWERWARQEREHFARHDPRGRADVVLNTQPSEKL